MKSVLNIHWKDWCWSWNSNTLATWCKELTLEKTLMLGKIEGRKRRGWQRMRWLDDITDTKVMILVGSRSWWWIWKSGMLLSVGSQRVGHDWVSELNQTKRGGSAHKNTIYSCLLNFNIQFTKDTHLKAKLFFRIKFHLLILFYL